MIVLKSCPFCGRKPEFSYYVGDYGYTPNSAYISCKHCGVDMKMEGSELSERSAFDCLSAVWNRRVNNG